MRKVFFVMLVILFYGFFVQPVFAYVDPETGSVIFGSLGPLFAAIFSTIFVSCLNIFGSRRVGYGDQKTLSLGKI